MPPPTAKAELTVRENRESLRALDREIDLAFDGLVKPLPAGSAPREGDISESSFSASRWEELATQRDSALTPGQERLFQPASVPLDPGYEIFDVLRDVYEFEATAWIVDGYDTSPVYAGLKGQLEGVKEMLEEYGSDLTVDAAWRGFYETAHREMQDASEEILATGALSFPAKLKLEHAFDDVRLATFRLAQETYEASEASTVEESAEAMPAGAAASIEGAILVRGGIDGALESVFRSVFLGE